MKLAWREKEVGWDWLFQESIHETCACSWNLFLDLTQQQETQGLHGNLHLLVTINKQSESEQNCG